MFYKAQPDACSTEVNKTFPNGLSERNDPLIVCDINNILDNKYFSNSACSSDLLQKSGSLISCGPGTEYFAHHTHWPRLAPSYNFFCSRHLWNNHDHRGKIQLSSLTEIFMEQMKHGHGETQEHGYFGDSMTSEQPFCQPLWVQVVPCGHSWQELLPLHCIFTQTCFLAPIPPAIACRLSFGHLWGSLPEMLSIHHITTCMQTYKTTSSGQAARDTGRESK